MRETIQPRLLKHAIPELCSVVPVSYLYSSSFPMVPVTVNRKNLSKLPTYAAYGDLLDTARAAAFGNRGPVRRGPARLS